MLKVGWFSTGNGAGSRGLLSFVMDRVRRGELPIDVRFVFSNREPKEHPGSDQFFGLARNYDIPVVHGSGRQFRRRVGEISKNRDAYDREVLELIAPYDVDVLVLAGYMLITSGELCRRYTMLNLHPALPGGPIGTWQEVIWQLIVTHAPRAGGMVHLATEQVDMGPVLAYFAFPIRGHEWEPLWAQVAGKSVAQLKASHGEELPLFKAIRRGQVLREPYLVAETLRAFSSGEVRVSGGRVVDQGARQGAGVDLSETIEQALKRDEAKTEH